MAAPYATACIVAHECSVHHFHTPQHQDPGTIGGIHSVQAAALRQLDSSLSDVIGPTPWLQHAFNTQQTPTLSPVHSKPLVAQKVGFVRLERAGCHCLSAAFLLQDTLPPQEACCRIPRQCFSDGLLCGCHTGPAGS
jgi:hypothetical protein